MASVNVEQAVIAGPATLGAVKLYHALNSGAYEDDAKFEFFKVLTYSPGTQPFFVSWLDDQPPGTCIIYNNLNGGNGGPPFGSAAAADAGSTFTVKGSNGSVPVKGTPGDFSATLSAAGTFLVPGTYTVAGSGGADIGPFNATITIPASPTLVSPVNSTTVTRSSGMTVTWTGGDPNGNVQITVTSATDNTLANGDQAICTAPASAGTFTIPPYVLLALPAGFDAGFVISPTPTGSLFTATGLTFGILTTQNDGTGFGYGAASGSFMLK